MKAVFVRDLLVFALLGSVFSFAVPGFAAVAVLTHHNDLNRSGANLEPA